MFKKILIANRGEIACRIIRTAHKLGIHCVAVYSAVDANAQHVLLADEAFCIGSAPSIESYLCADAILAVAMRTGAEAIHPGYGFLAENAEFAAACAAAGICFIGPPVAAIQAMGSKSAAKRLMATAGVPLVPGYHEAAQEAKVLRAAADKIGYPVLLKAVAGGGGKGMRVVWQGEEFSNALAGAKREAGASFGNDAILIEKYLTQPRHVEIQVFADQQGQTVYLFERDCSIQRRHQKIIEEAPAPGMTPALRQQMGESAVAAARAINYVGAGTVEFLLDEKQQFYFMEMNTRLQVEHPVTEMITGQDLVEWQFKVALGEALPLSQQQLTIHGHAFEVRVYAEDPQQDFLPSVGTIHYLKTPAIDEQVRLDSGVVAGDQISHYYDPLLAKLIVWGDDRSVALQRLVKALAHYQVVGVMTNLNLLTAIAKHPLFAGGEFDTGFIFKQGAILLAPPPVSAEILALASLYVLLTRKNKTLERARQNLDHCSPWSADDSWRMNLPARLVLVFYHHEVETSVVVQPQAEGYLLLIEGREFIINGKLLAADNLIATLNECGFKATIFAEQAKLHLLVQGLRYQLQSIEHDAVDHNLHAAEIKAHLTAPMPSKVVAQLVKLGEQVSRGAGLLVVEAMKMEHTIYAPAEGSVREWYFNVGDIVTEGAELLAFEETT